MGKRCVLAEEKMLRNDCFSEELMFGLMYFSASFGLECKIIIEEYSFMV